MTLVSVDDSLIKEAMAELTRKDEALVKAAAVQVELDVVYEVMDLVARGQIDPDDPPILTSSIDRLLIASWGRCKGCAADLNGDGVVNAADLGLLVVGWGPCP